MYLILYRDGYNKNINNVKINCKIWRINHFVSKIYKMIKYIFLNIKIISIWEILDLIINWCSFQNFKDTWNYT